MYMDSGMFYLYIYHAAQLTICHVSKIHCDTELTLCKHTSKTMSSEGGYEWRAFTQISKEAFKQQRSQLKNPQKRLDSYFIFDANKLGEWTHDFNLKVKGRDALVPCFEFKYSPEGNPSQNIHKCMETKIVCDNIL